VSTRRARSSCGSTAPIHVLLPVADVAPASSKPRAGAVHRTRSAATFTHVADGPLFEEDEEVYVTPEPYTRIDVLAGSRSVRVDVDGVTVAESHHPTLLFETGLPTRYYSRRPTSASTSSSRPTRSPACPYQGRRVTGRCARAIPCTRISHGRTTIRCRKHSIAASSASSTSASTSRRRRAPGAPRTVFLTRGPGTTRRRFESRFHAPVAASSTRADCVARRVLDGGRARIAAARKLGASATIDEVTAAGYADAAARGSRPASSGARSPRTRRPSSRRASSSTREGDPARSRTGAARPQPLPRARRRAHRGVRGRRDHVIMGMKRTPHASSNGFAPRSPSWRDRPGRGVNIDVVAGRRVFAG